MSVSAMGLSDDELRAAVVEASHRFGPWQVAEWAHEWVRAERAERKLAEFEQRVGSWGERAAATGLVRAGSGLIHVWDCPSILRVIRQTQEWLTSDEPAQSALHGSFPSLPKPLTLAEARAVRARSRAKRVTCSTCCPDV